MKIDPRNPPKDALVPTDNPSPYYGDIYKILVLLYLETKDKPVYFLIQDVETYDRSYNYSRFQGRQKYIYEEHHCPTNFIDVEQICYKGNMDQHGIFKFVEAIWMTDEYESLDSFDQMEYLQEVFPQLRGTDDSRAGEISNPDTW